MALMCDFQRKRSSASGSGHVSRAGLNENHVKISIMMKKVLE